MYLLIFFEDKYIEEIRDDFKGVLNSLKKPQDSVSWIKSIITKKYESYKPVLAS